MSTKEDAAMCAATANANMNIWGAVIALLEGGLLSGQSDHYHPASQEVIKIAQAQMQMELTRYDTALAKVRAPVPRRVKP